MAAGPGGDETMTQMRNANYGHVPKRDFEFPKCTKCGGPINPPRGPSGHTYSVCAQCIIDDPWRSRKEKSKRRKELEAAGL